MWQVLTAQAEGLDPERLSRTYAALMVERQLQEATRMNADEDMQDAGTRDSFCSSASTDPGGGVSPRESMPALSPCASPRAHEEATRAGSVPAAAAEVQDAASRPPGADSFPFAGPAPPGWKPDASFSLEHALHKELLQQLITLVVDTRGSKKLVPEARAKPAALREASIPVAVACMSKVAGDAAFADMQRARSMQAHDIYNPSFSNFLVNIMLVCIGNTHGSATPLGNTPTIIPKSQ